MKTKFHLFTLLVLIVTSSCSTKNDTNKLLVNIPSVPYLDSICNENSNALYDWTLETYKSEKSIINTKDLDIKENRGVKFIFKKNKFVIYPFFKKNSSNSQILMLHLLLIDEKLNINKLKSVSFNRLIKIQNEKAYYYFK